MVLSFTRIGSGATDPGADILIYLKGEEKLTGNVKPKDETTE